MKSSWFLVCMIAALLLAGGCSDDPSDPDPTPTPDLTPPEFGDAVALPGDEAVDVERSVQLAWSAAVDAESEVAGYRVLLDAADPPTTEIWSGSDTTCAAGSLYYDTTYHWRVIAEDEAGNEVESPVWSFTTLRVDEFVLITAGTFIMGSPETEYPREVDEDQHQVTLTRDYRVSPFEVTEALYDEVMGDGTSTSQYPVVEVTWVEAVQFCNALSVRRDLTPAYGFDGENWNWNQDADGYRLLTEAEWEYACRAGTSTAFETGICLDAGTEANYDGHFPIIGCLDGPFLESTDEVGSYSPNAWGLYDMHGNVQEWCWDGYEEYPAEAVVDPVGVGTMRVLRGGDWSKGAWDCRSAGRNRNSPTTGTVGWSFRLARTEP